MKVFGCVLLLLVPLLLVSANAECPPSSGIYLMLGDECIANGTWFRDSNLQIANGQDGYIHCVLPNETLNGGQWVKPDGEAVNCTTSGINGINKPWFGNLAWKNPFYCTDDSPNANITLYLDNDDYFSPTVETEYKCCLPNDCSDPSTNIMTINVFERVYIIDVYVDLPTDITAIPQTYTVHCIVTGALNDATIKQYYDDDDDDTELTQLYCATDHDGYSCTLTNTSVTTYNTYSDTRDYMVTVEWEGKNISNGVFTQSVNNGDHKHICTAASGAIEPKHKGRTQTITIKAPSSSPSNLSVVSVSFSSITISWTYPNISDDVVYGYVVNASNINDYTVVNTASNNQTTLDGLLPGTNYTIIVRAYQDILGPPSEGIMVTTKDAPPPLMSWSRVSPITSLLDTQYSIECTTSNVHPSLVYWTVNGVKMSNTNYTLVDESNMTYNSTLLLYPNNGLGQSVNVTCSIQGVRNATIVLKASSAVLQINGTITQFLPYSINININWTLSDDLLNDINGFIISITPNGPVYEFNSSTTHTTIPGLMANTLYTITLYTYSDLISIGINISIIVEPAIMSSSTTESSLTTMIITSSTPIPPFITSITTTTLLSLSTAITSIITPLPTEYVPTGISSSFMGGIVGGTVVVIVLVILIVTVMIIIGRKRHTSSPKDKTTTENEPEYAEINPQTIQDPKRYPDDIPMQSCEPYSLHKPLPHHTAGNTRDVIDMQACEAYSSYHRPGPIPGIRTETNTRDTVYY